MPQPTAPPSAPTEPQIDSAAARRAYAQDLLDEAKKIKDDYQVMLKRRDANRQALRQMHIQGHLSASHKRLFAEFYPQRKRGEGQETPPSTNNA